MASTSCVRPYVHVEHIVSLVKMNYKTIIANLSNYDEEAQVA